MNTVQEKKKKKKKPSTLGSIYSLLSEVLVKDCHDGNQPYTSLISTSRGDKVNNGYTLCSVKRAVDILHIPSEDKECASFLRTCWMKAKLLLYIRTAPLAAVQAA